MTYGIYRESGILDDHKSVLKGWVWAYSSLGLCFGWAGQLGIQPTTIVITSYTLLDSLRSQTAANQMTRRIHATDVGSIACTDLSELGAGKEGWLVNDQSLVCALDAHYIAVAKKYFVFIINWTDPNQSGFQAKIRPDLSPIEAEHITALEWLVFEDFRVIAVGTSRGYLLVYDLKGDLLHKQVLTISIFLISNSFFCFDVFLLMMGCIG